MPHIVALAHRNGDLDKFISWRLGKKYNINATNVAESGLPKGSIGKKTAQRKGISKKKSAKIRKVCAETDDSLWQSRASAISQPAQCQSTSSPAVSRPDSSSTPPQLQPTLLRDAATSQCVSRQEHSISPSCNSQLPALPNICNPSFHQPQMQPFVLTFIRGNISVCFGCKQHYRKPVSPPNDLCLMHREWRTFTTPSSPSPQSRFGNAYYHPNLPCIQSMWPLFNPQQHLVITGDTTAALLPSHRQVLYTLLGILIN